MTPVDAALTFVSLVAIIDPLAIAPAFGALTQDMPPGRARRTARVSVVAGFALIAVAGLAGHTVLRAIGAEIALVHLVVAAALIVIGGLMFAGKAASAGPGDAHRRDPALFPLAVPLIAGPGAFAAMVMFAGKNAGNATGTTILYTILAIVAILTYLTFLGAGPITRKLGPRGVAMIPRLLGLLLMGAGAKLLYDGLRDYWHHGGAGVAG